MVRNQYSYWLYAQPAQNASHTLDDVLAALNGSALAVPYGPMVFSIYETYVFGEVDPNQGSTEEDNSVRETVVNIAAKFPDFEFTLEENDEDDRSNGVTTKYSGETCAYKRYVRTLQPNEYDDQTVRAIADYLEKNGWPDAAANVRAKKFT